jgi:hypothetical protein
MLLNSSTSPAAVGLAPPIVAACTTYGQYLQIQVWDQFYNPLSGVYSGAPVTESLNGQISWIPINQAIQGDGTYEDPVMEIPGPTPLLNPSIPADAAAIAAWPGAAPNAPTNGYSPQSVDVAVAGFVLQDMHGDQAISSREVTFTVIPNVQNQCTYTIVWPN